jgi:hypothetical protein
MNTFKDNEKPLLHFKNSAKRGVLAVVQQENFSWFKGRGKLDYLDL